jgi:hypothetical protein
MEYIPRSDAILVVYPIGAPHLILHVQGGETRQAVCAKTHSNACIKELFQRHSANTYYLGMNLGNILIIGYTDQGYCQKCPWDRVLPNKINSQEGSYPRIECYHYCGQSSISLLLLGQCAIDVWVSRGVGAEGRFVQEPPDDLSQIKAAAGMRIELRADVPGRSGPRNRAGPA